MHLSYDATVDVAYLSLRPLRPGEQLGPNLLMEPDRDFPGTIMLDFSADDGEVVGLEFGMASRCLPALLLATAERTDGEHLSSRLAERVTRRFANDAWATGRIGRPRGRRLS